MGRPPRAALLPATLTLLSTQVFSSSLLSPPASEDLGIEIIQAFDCHRRSHPGDTISVHYSGRLEDGTTFDSSYSRNAPFEFTLGAGQVIRGWDSGLLEMCAGDERRLTIPSSMGYGNQAIGPIPAGSTLIFETRLISINGEEKEADAVPASDESTNLEEDLPSIPSTTDEEIAAASQQPIPGHPGENPGEGDDDGEDNGDDDDDNGDNTKPGAGDGVCRLLGPFAIFVQGGLGLLALSSLVWKRYHESPRRPFKIWFFDASKQVFGSVLLHVLNLLMSIMSPTDFDLAHKAQELTAQLQHDRQVNPCSWYLINIAIDTTIGIPILVVLLRLLTRAFALTPLARPPESIKSGHYGQPPRATWWLKQAMIYFIGLALMKLCVFIIIQLLPWIALVGDWALRWTQGSEALQVAFVMFVFPLIMNAIQYYIIDSFIKDKSSTDQGEDAAARVQEDGHGPYQSIHSRDSMDSTDFERDDATAKEAEIEVQPELGDGDSSNSDDLGRRPLVV